MTTSLTQFFRFGIPDFTTGPWHSDFAAMVRHIDRAMYELLVTSNVTPWANSTAYSPGVFVIDSLTGFIYDCLVAHTSIASPGTFADDRAAHPTFWGVIAPAAAEFIAFTPYKTVVQFNVQDAIEWLEDNKAPRFSGVQILTGAGPVTVANSTGKLILNKSAPSATTVNLPLLANYELEELLISDFAGNAGDITIVPGSGERIHGLAPDASWIVGSGGAGLGGNIRLSRILTVGWAIG